MPRLLMPALYNGFSPRPPVPDPGPPPILSALEQAFIGLVTAHPDQKRSPFRLHATLCQVARARATDMAERGYFSHTDPDQHGPNYHVRAAGYALPAHYGSGSGDNSVESIAAGQTTAAQALEGWVQSPAHRRHVLAETDFYRQQTNVGIGHCKLDSSRYKNYWVFISAPPERGAA